LTSGGGLALYFSNLPYFILQSKNKRLSFQMYIPDFTSTSCSRVSCWSEHAGSCISCPCFLRIP